MSFEDFKIITTDNAGSTLRYGGNDFKEIMQMLNGVVLSNRRPRIATPWRWLSNTLTIMNPANTFAYSFESSAITADRKIILPALASDATLIVDTAANIFTASQEVQTVATAELLKLYRPEAANTDIDISFYWRDSLGNKTRYAVLRAAPTNTTDGQETALFDIFLLTNGVFVRNLRLENTGLFTIRGTGSTGFSLSPTGLTNVRTFTWPDIGGKIATDTNANVFTAAQKISLNSTLLHTYYAPKTSGSIQILFDFNNAAAAEVGYGRMQVRAVTSTTGAQEGEFGINLWKAGVERNGLLYGYLTGDEAFFAIYKAGFGSPAIQFRTTGLTAERVFTFPNLNGAISTAEVNETVTGIKTWKAANVSSKTSQASAAELIQSWTVDDSAGGSKVEILNASSVNAVFSPWLRSFNMDTAAPALFFYGYIGNALDTGTDSVLRFDARKADNSAIVNRTLFSFRNAGAELFAITATSFLFANQFLGNIGRMEHNVPSVAGTAEVVHQWKVNDDASSYMQVINATGTDAIFAPMIKAANLASASLGALHLFARINTTHDTGTVPVFWLDARLNNDTAITTRPLFQLRNTATTHFQINAKGDIVQTTLAQSGVAEQFHEWKVSDSTGYVRLRNQGGDGAIAPEWAFYNNGSTSALPSLSYLNYINSAMDTGTAPIIKWSTRNSNETAIVVRPLFQLNNLNTTVFQINTESFDFTDRPLLNTRGTADLPIAEGNQSRRHGTVEAPALTATGHILAGTWSSYGTHAGSSDSAEGSRDITSTGATLGTAAGWKCSSVHFARRSYNPKLLTKFALQQITNQRFFFGLLGTGATIGNTDDPVGTNAAFLFGVITTNANFVIIHNVASGATPTVVDTGIPVDTALRTIEIEADNSLGWRWRMSTTSTLGAWSAYINTNVPSSSSSLACHYHLINSAAEDKIVHHFITSYQSKK